MSTDEAAEKVKASHPTLFTGWGHLRNALGFALRASLTNTNAQATDVIRRLSK